MPECEFDTMIDSVNRQGLWILGSSDMSQFCCTPQRYQIDVPLVRENLVEKVELTHGADPAIQDHVDPPLNFYSHEANRIPTLLDPRHNLRH